MESLPTMSALKKEVEWWEIEENDIKPLTHESGTDSSSEQTQDNYEDDESQDGEKDKQQKIKEKSANQILVEKIYELLSTDFHKFKTLDVSINNKGSFTHNLTTQSYYVEPFGYLGIVLKKAEAYYIKTTQKVNISHIRCEIDGIQSELRIALIQNNYKHQEKLCIRLQERRKILQDALAYVEKVKTKTTDLDIIRDAISIVCSNKGRSQKFCNLFKSYCKTKVN